MGLFSWLFNSVGKLVKSLFGIILCIIVLILIFRGYSKFGDSKKLDKSKGQGFYEYSVKDLSSNQKFTVAFLNDTDCTVDRIKYSYHFTKYLYSTKTGVLGLETVLEDKNNGEEKIFRIVQAKRIEKDSYFDAFLQGKEIPKNDLHVQEVTVDYKTWNNDREYLPSMEYELMDAMVRDLMASPSYIGILQ